MHSQNTTDIDDLMAAMQKKWGRDALQSLAKVETDHAFIPTGFPMLDAAIGIGGIAQHRLTSLYGQMTSGVSSLAYTMMAQAQQNEIAVVYLDPPQTFDPEYATRRGVDEKKLLLMQPETWDRVLDILRDTIGFPLRGLLVLDADTDDLASSKKHKALTTSLQRVAALLPQTSWTLLVLVPADLPVPVDSQASLRLRLEWEAWLYEDDLICGYRVKITILKNKLAALTAPISIDIFLEG